MLNIVRLRNLIFGIRPTIKVPSKFFARARSYNKVDLLYETDHSGPTGYLWHPHNNSNHFNIRRHLNCVEEMKPNHTFGLEVGTTIPVIKRSMVPKMAVFGEVRSKFYYN